jgi:signal transduction histidine kinase
MLEELLEERRVTIHEQHLVVLKELGPGGQARGDVEQLRFAFQALLDKSLQLVPERGSLYLASRHHGQGLGGAPSVRVLLRFRGPGERGPGERGPGDRGHAGEGRPAPAPIEGLELSETSLEFAVADAIVRAHGGALAIQSADAGETVIVVDLPADADEAA